MRVSTHMTKSQTTRVEIEPIGEGECLQIKIGDNDDYFIAEQDFCLFLSTSQLVDLYGKLSLEMEKYGVHS